MSEGHSTDFARVCQEKFSPIPDSGKFSLQQWATIFGRNDTETVAGYFEEIGVPCYEFGSLVIVDARDLWAAKKPAPYQRRTRERKAPDGKKKSKRRRKPLQDE